MQEVRELMRPIKEKTKCEYANSCPFSGNCDKEKCDDDCLKLIWEDIDQSRQIIQDCVSRMSVNRAFMNVLYEELDY